MKYLLDTNVLLAGIITEHKQHPPTFDWLAGKRVVLCPLAELGFLRISTNKKVFNYRMEKARGALARFGSEREAERIPDDLPPLDSNPSLSEEVTDVYLADLAAKHGLKLATLDTRIVHPAAEVICRATG